LSAFFISLIPFLGVNKIVPNLYILNKYNLPTNFLLNDWWGLFSME